ncbi:caspase family protein [Mesobacterium pallidum]|uniref:caspase family protein n=1 Tax=Mesobacterium pallidum TaxID=2872037 RepID=UPI001EE2D159|nr:caspase family protein [Mesobacterium pallidum]
MRHFRTLLRFALLGLLVGLSLASPIRAQDRVALVIGNSDYTHAPYLPNAVRDARDVARALRSIGFAVHDGYDLTRTDTLRLIDEVTRGLRSDQVALFYFSGHGIQIGGENFVIPVDARGEEAAELKTASVNLQSLLREMELRADRNIIILDACRNNPFEARMTGRSLGSVSRGLARLDAGVDSYIAFSTQPGNVALDGEGANSPFTAALLRHLPDAGADLHGLMRAVRADVVRETDGAQIHWENSSLIDQIYLGAPGGRRPAATGGGQATVAAVAPQPVPQVTTPGFTHVVSGLDPHGDGFLALRDGTTSGARRLAKMVEGTRLTTYDQRGPWLYVRTETGLMGWAHSNWIRALPQAAPPQPVRPVQGTSCDALWYERNAYFARHGYCFTSARGKAAFPNAGCNPALAAADVPLSTAERAALDRIRAREAQMGCN